MISTATYIYDLSGSIGDSEAYLLNDYIRSVTQGSKHAVVSALANITDGGSDRTLAANLKTWSTIVEKRYAFGTFTLSYSLLDSAPYTSGLYINWGTDGNGVSEAFADFMLNASGRELKMQYPFSDNVSTRLHVEGYLTQVSPSATQVVITYQLSNEGQPALAQNIAVYYKESNIWLAPTLANNYVLLDYGNGTYRATFTSATLATSLDVSARVSDMRGVFVQANATLTTQ
jgi:hypothetical protein